MVYFCMRSVTNCFFFFTGDLLPRHMEIFSNNSFFKGLTIPTPDVLVSVVLIFNVTV